MNDAKILSATDILDQLNDAKSELSARLGGVKVVVLEKDHPEVYNAIRGLFGEGYVKDGVATITFHMVTECMRITRLAGKGKAQELIK